MYHMAFMQWADVVGTETLLSGEITATFSGPTHLQSQLLSWAHRGYKNDVSRCLGVIYHVICCYAML